MLPADSRMIPPRIKPPHPSSSIPLSIMEASVDDMYAGCAEPMMNKVKKKYMVEELKGDFKKVWNGADKCVKKGVEQKDSKTKLSEDHIRAICAFTVGGRYNLYEKFNVAVRNSRKHYASTSFEYHTLHFLLTEAIQALKNSQGGCLTTYRRTNLGFTGDINQIVRFGQFASSSKNPNFNSNKFGKKTCFIIKTCYGADLKKYPALNDTEEEVLIPPYEVFKIVPKQKKETMQCDKVFKLESAGKLSNLNCMLVSL